MKHFKKISLLLLALLLALSFAACTDNAPAEEPIEEPPVEEPGYYEDDDGYLLPVPPIGEIDEETDWSQYSVIVNGVGVLGASFTMIGDDAIFPTHVSLMAVAERGFHADVFWNVQTDEVFFPGLNGNIHFFAGSAEFTVEGETITLEQESLRIGDEIYVPIQFFRDVFGAGSAYFLDGHVFIDIEGGDME